MDGAPGAPPAAPAGWYPDPSRRDRLRYWDGRAWTPGVARDGEVAEEAPPQGAPGPAAREPDERAAWPARAVWLALAGALAGSVLAGVLVVVADRPAGSAVWQVALGQAGLWAGLLGACWVASRRYGSGHLARDFGLRLRASDVPVGLGVSLLARVVGVLFVLPLVAVSEDLVGTNTDVIADLADDVPALVAIVAFALVGAPLVEELFFRGLIQRALTPVLRTGGAVVVQAVLFGLVHTTVDLGAANASVVLATGGAGLVFGITAHRAGRLGPSVLAHAWYNLVGVAAALSLA